MTHKEYFDNLIEEATATTASSKEERPIYRKFDLSKPSEMNRISNEFKALDSMYKRGDISDKEYKRILGIVKKAVDEAQGYHESVRELDLLRVDIFEAFLDGKINSDEKDTLFERANEKEEAFYEALLNGNNERELNYLMRDVPGLLFEKIKAKVRKAKEANDVYKLRQYKSECNKESTLCTNNARSLKKILGRVTDKSLSVRIKSKIDVYEDLAHQYKVLV